MPFQSGQKVLQMKYEIQIYGREGNAGVFLPGWLGHLSVLTKMFQLNHTHSEIYQSDNGFQVYEQPQDWSFPG